MEHVRDVAQLNQFLNGTGVRALFDAPWLPIYLCVIALMHPWLGITAAIGAVALSAIAVATERLTRSDSDALLRRSRGVGRHAESLVRQAEVFVGLGMVPTRSTRGAASTRAGSTNRRAWAPRRLACRRWRARHARPCR